MEPVGSKPTWAGAIVLDPGEPCIRGDVHADRREKPEAPSVSSG